MRTPKDERGSALLMVIGLLTILGMLGGTFLVVASMHRRVALGTLRAAPLRDAPGGILQEIINVLLADLFIGQVGEDAYAPYAAGQGEEGKCTDSAASDKLLDPEEVGKLLFGDVEKGDQVDTDQDGELDSYLYPTTIFNAKAQEIHASALVIDLSGRINANTAYDKTASTPPVNCPVMIGLKELLTKWGVSFDDLHRQRCGGSNPNPQTFATGCALRLSRPGDYEPFDVGDEVPLRWLQAGAATNAGRLYEIFEDVDYETLNLGLLTTISRSRVALRNPTLDRRVRLQVSTLAALDDENARNWLHQELVKAFTGGKSSDQQIVDDGDAGWSGSGGWVHVSGAGGYNGDFHMIMGGSGSNVASWAFTSLPEGEYQVFATWTVGPNPGVYASNAKYVLYDGGDALGTASVNQQNEPGDLVEGGFGWKSLGTVGIKNGTLKVDLSDAANGVVIADAVMFQRKASSGPVASTPPDYLVANLWAYMSAKSPNDCAFKVGSAYGVVPQLVITEAYAYSLAESAPGANDNGWCYAVELTNPTEYSVNTGNYYLQCGTLGTYDFPGAGVGAGSSIVIYDFDGQVQSGTTRSKAKASDFGITGTTAHRANGKLDFSSLVGGDVRIGRKVGGEDIPVDKVSPSDIGYAVNDKKTEGAIAVAQRDDNPSRARALVAKWKKLTPTEPADNRLGKPNGLGEGDINALKGFVIKKASSLPRNLGDLISSCLIVGADAETDLPHKLAGDNAMRGRVDYTASRTGAGPYPSAPLAGLLAELLERVPADPKDESLRHGRINPNTAPKEVLELLPFPAYLDLNGNGRKDGGEPEVVAEDVAQAIIDGRPYHTPGAVAAVLTDHAKKLLQGMDENPRYPDACSSLYNAVSNLLTASSDTFAVYIRTQIGPGKDTGAHYHVAVIDRSNCTRPEHRPMILMLTQVE